MCCNIWWTIALNCLKITIYIKMLHIKRKKLNVWYSEDHCSLNKVLYHTLEVNPRNLTWCITPFMCGREPCVVLAWDYTPPLTWCDGVGTYMCTTEGIFCGQPLCKQWINKTSVLLGSFWFLPVCHDANLIVNDNCSAQINWAITTMDLSYI